MIVIFRWVKVLIFLVSTAVFSSQPGPEYKTFEGAWFSVEYPSGFTVVPSLESFSSDGYDSVFFVSPDEEIKFYVFAPQWGGKPSDIEFREANENFVSETEKKVRSFHHKWWTIEAKDHSYMRSYHSITSQDNTNSHVIGIQYANEKILSHYSAVYLHFKKSLQLFGD